MPWINNNGRCPLGYQSFSDSAHIFQLSESLRKACFIDKCPFLIGPLDFEQPREFLFDDYLEMTLTISCWADHIRTILGFSKVDFNISFKTMNAFHGLSSSLSSF